MMKHVVAFDISMGKSTMVIYNQYRQCDFEGEILHNRTSFEQLHEILQTLIAQDGQPPEIVFEATGVYSKALERFFLDHDYVYYRLNPLEARHQCGDRKPIKAMRTSWQNPIFGWSVDRPIKKRSIITRCEA